MQDVLRELDQPRAYTTIMTTLDRLFKKGLLDRQKERNWFRYTPKFSRAEWGQEQARDWFAGFLAGSSGPDVLLSSLVDAVGEQDVSLLDELQCKVALRKKQVQDGPTSGDT